MAFADKSRQSDVLTAQKKLTMKDKQALIEQEEELQWIKSLLSPIF